MSILLFALFVFFFFFKQKTAYEMRISDWSSDVCSSDLKGPQGTVFGKNTSAGVINVVTRLPSYTQSAEGEITVGNYGAFGVSGSYNDALGDAAAFSVYAAKRKRDGWMDVRTGNGPRTNDEDYDQNYHTFRGKLLLEPTDTLDILLSGDFTSREENCCT